MAAELKWRLLFLLVVDLNLSGGGSLLQLWHNDAEDAVLQAGLDVLVVDAGRESEAPSKFTDTAFRDPVCVLRLVFADFFAAGGCDLCARGLLLLLLFCSLLALALLLSRRLLAFFAVVFGAAFDGEGGLVGEFDGHVLLLNARQLALEDVLVFGFLDVELGREAALGRVLDLLQLREGVVEEFEEWLHFVPVRSECRAEAWEESHVA